MEEILAEKVKDLSPEELQLYRIRHSLAHVLADAVTQLYPGTACGFGPPVENGFYYDFDLPKKLEADDLPEIEKKMRQIIAGHHDFIREDYTPTEAIPLIEKLGQSYKLEMAKELEEKKVASISLYKHNNFTDVCEGPHVANTKELQSVAFKLDTIAGSYWRGSEKNPMLTRIYALAFRTKEELAACIKQREEAKARDHRKLGAELDIFHIDPDIGLGLPLWLPNGTVIREELEKLAKEFEFKYGYSRVATPDIAREQLYYRSGHLPYYKKSMFPPMTLVETDDNGEETSRETFYLRPMNCPHHHMIFKARPRSYRDLPLRLTEYGHDYRFEKSGQLSGLLRVRGMCMNDAHIYVPEEIAKEEFMRVMQLHMDYYKLLEFSSWRMRLSLPSPDNTKYLPKPDLWNRAINVCIEGMKDLGLDYEAVEGEAAFYGPKIDVQVKNVIGREETASTNQVDPMAAQEDRFDMTYVGKDGGLHRPFVLHRAPLGTHERFIAFLIEHFAGAFPTWLAPVQVAILPVTSEQHEYAEKIRQTLFNNFVRVEVDDSSDTLGKKIRRGTTRKIPILLIIGQQEQADNVVTIRRYTKQQAKETMPVDTFVASLMDEIKRRLWIK